MSDTKDSDLKEVVFSQGTPEEVVPHKSRRTKGKKTSSRKSDAQIRKFMADEKHGILLKLERTDGTETSNAWKCIEKCGFTVSKDGCLLPYDRYWPHSGQSGEKLGHICSAVTFNDAKLKDLGKKGTNQFGWPTTLEVSHLCHVSMCCNPAHLVVEEAWKNKKRNYCGLEGTCDCGVTPQCLLRYRSSSSPFSLRVCTYSTRGLKNFIQSKLPDSVKVKVLSEDHYRKQDLKRANRKKRKQAASVHLKQTQENNKKRKK